MRKITHRSRKEAQRRKKNRLRRLGSLPWPKAKRQVNPEAAPTVLAAADRTARVTVSSRVPAVPGRPAPPRTPVEPTAEDLALPATSLNLTPHARKAITGAGITTLGDFQGWEPGVLAALKGITAETVASIRQQLAGKNITLKGERLGR